MNQTAAVIASTFGGLTAGAVVGWVVGRRLKLHGIAWFIGVAGCFLVCTYMAFQAAVGGEALAADAWLGAAFGSMTAVKYAAGLLPGTGASEPAREPLSADAPQTGAPASDDRTDGAAGESEQES